MQPSVGSILKHLNLILPSPDCITLPRFHRVHACRKLHESRITISFWWLGQTLSDRLQYLMVPKQQPLNSLRGMPVLSFPSASIVQSCWAIEFNWVQLRQAVTYGIQTSECGYRAGCSHQDHSFACSVALSMIEITRAGGQARTSWSRLLGPTECIYGVPVSSFYNFSIVYTSNVSC